MRLSRAFICLQNELYASFLGKALELSIHSYFQLSLHYVDSSAWENIRLTNKSFWSNSRKKLSCRLEPLTQTIESGIHLIYLETMSSSCQSFKYIDFYSYSCVLLFSSSAELSQIFQKSVASIALLLQCVCNEIRSSDLIRAPYAFGMLAFGDTTFSLYFDATTPRLAVAQSNQIMIHFPLKRTSLV